MLNQIEAALLKSRGYELQPIQPLARGYCATAMKGNFRAAALGSSPEDAVRKLIQVVIRP